MIDREARQRKRAIRILVVDVIMAVSVVAIVLVLVGVVAGWRIGANMTLEQNGLVQINSEPTGATLTIDGETQLGTTNASKMLTGGEHEIVLTKEGYESWGKTVTVTPGWLLNLRYARLFKQNREKQVVQEFEKLEFVSAAPDRKGLLYAVDNLPAWYFVTDLGSEKPKETKVNFDDLLPDVVPTTDDALKTVEVKTLEWNRGGDKVLVQTSNDIWLLLNLKNPKESVNISAKIEGYTGYAALTASLQTKQIAQAKFANAAGTEIFAKIEKLLFKVDLNDGVVTSTPAVEVADFAVHGSEVIYTTVPDKKDLRYINMYKDGDRETVRVYVAEKKSDSLKVALSEYYGKKYVIFTVGPRLYVYRGENYPVSHIGELEKVAENDTFIVPNSLEVSSNGEFFVLRKGTEVVMYDAEVEKYHEYAFINEKSQWLDGYILYGVEENNLMAWDFDGTNPRTLVVDDAVAGYDALINSNNKYMYYVAKTEDGLQLRREKL